jgi:hypothetical protein
MVTGKFKATGDIKCEVKFDDKNQLLTARGIKVGVILRIVGRFTAPDWDAYDALTRHVKKLLPRKHDNFWRTMVLDQDMRVEENVPLDPPPPGPDFEKSGHASGRKRSTRPAASRSGF